MDCPGIVVRKAYGLGVQAMCGASSRVGFFTAERTKHAYINTW
ncbi:MAG: hypothetical protein QF664_11680 [Dehalococcoidia bacterium]|jgi:acetyl-CoA carboxylase carboxyltransferase component|nr:hypothetical protein [Dehalococcoidia bacterium]